ncbi:hypothetical protein EXU85_07180 [Spirosoma sp. KCTC 42546]|uniref:hypothetical protein n=1 Tax=Spirosoma sp. KCTC 42546 TaxID=2520506 RepID=UPI00115B6638|nr:hypothetical protein [Spirosoma sp. KCTC 42546]QDK78398.1 hypothetical protein EXU85_07180 [Spirosoma sp. KCTC 42546]
MNLLLLKITLIPAVIALVTLAIRKWGNKIGGLIGSMPWVAGPILLFFIAEQGKAFGIQSIQGTMTGILALISFCFSYSTLSQKLSWLPTLVLSYVIYTITAVVVNYLQLNLSLSYVLVIGSVLVALRFFPVPKEQSTSARRLPFDILIRMVVATLFVLVITGLASILGPNWSGILTPFPILTSILAIFSHSLQGSNATISTLRGLVIGLLGFTTFLFLQAFLLPSFSITISFGLAFVLNVFINLMASRVW